MLTEYEVEGVGDLQCFLVTVNGDDFDAEALDESRIIRGRKGSRFRSSQIVFVSLVCSTQGAGSESLWSLDPAQSRTVKIAVKDLNGW